MSAELIKGRTRGGDEWIPSFITDLNQSTCIGCGRCYKVCPRDVFELVDRGEALADDDDDWDDAVLLSRLYVTARPNTFLRHKKKKENLQRAEKS